MPPIELAIGRIERSGARRAHASTQHVGANYEEAICVDWLPRTNHRLPPARFTGYWVNIGYVLIAGERVTHKNSVRPLRIEHAIRLVSD